MSKPAALRKAEALARHLFPLQEIAAVTLSDREAWGLLKWQRSMIPADFLAEYDSDVREARALKDPWPMLKSFRVLGFPLERLPNEVH